MDDEQVDPPGPAAKCANEAKSPPASSWLSCARRSPKLLTLTLECRADDDVDVVADERHQCANAELGPLNLRGRIEAHCIALVERIDPGPVEYCVQNDRLRRSMQSEIADDIGFPGSGHRDLRCLERDVWILDRIEPFLAFQFAIELGVRRTDASDRDSDIELARGWVLRIEIERPRDPAEFAVVSRESEVRNGEKNPSVERLHGESAALGLRGIVDRTSLRRNLARAQCAEQSDDCLSHDNSSLRKSVGIEAGYQ